VKAGHAAIAIQKGVNPCQSLVRSGHRQDLHFNAP
jgi:hypothetical protein